MRLFILTIIAFSIGSCTNHKELPEPAACPDKVISYAQDVQAIFDANCATSGCHSGTTPAANFTLAAGSSFQELSREGSGYINTTNPRFSVLYSQLNSLSNPMPPTGQLSACDKKIIYDWMLQGAKNN